MTVDPIEMVAIQNNVNYYNQDFDEENEEFDDEETYHKKRKITKITIQLIIMNKLIFIFLFLFSLFFLYAMSSSTINLDRVIISPSYDYNYDYDYDNDNDFNSDFDSNSNYNYYFSFKIIKPCIYKNKNNTFSCNKNYQLINEKNICDQNSGTICLLNNLTNINNNIYSPNCLSVQSLNNLYNNGHLVNNTVIINYEYYDNNVLIITIYSFVPIFVIVALIYYIRCIYFSPKLENYIELCYHMYHNFVLYAVLVLITIVIMDFGIYALIGNSSIKFISEIITINCSNLNIYDSLNFVQKVLVGWNLNISEYAKYFEYLYEITIGTNIILFVGIIYIILRISCL